MERCNDTSKPEDVLIANHLILDKTTELNQGRVEDGATAVSWVKIGKGFVIFGRSVVRGPAIIGENCKTGPSAYIGSYTAIGDRCHVTVAEVDDSIVMDDTTTDVERKIVRNTIGKGSKILSANGLLPKGERLVVGENTTLYHIGASEGTLRSKSGSPFRLAVHSQGLDSLVICVNYPLPGPSIQLYHWTAFSFWFFSLDDPLIPYTLHGIAMESRKSISAHLSLLIFGERMKLNIGCGSSISDGWINIDISLNIYFTKIPYLKRTLFRLDLISKETYESKWSGKYIRRDVTRGLPFRSESVDFIYSSHLLEHMHKDDAEAFLRECYRVLKVGGVLRLVVPDLEALCRAYISKAASYVQDEDTLPADAFLSELGILESKKRTYLERRLGRGNWHLWMYDEASLTSRLRKAGFSGIVSSSFRKGQVPDLDRIETRNKDSIYVESTK